LDQLITFMKGPIKNEQTKFSTSRSPDLRGGDRHVEAHAPHDSVRSSTGAARDGEGLV